MSFPATFTVYNASAGSGKTFTLVKEYLKIILASEDIYQFQQILAVTFTNKAAQEMKKRVLKSLQQYAEGAKDDLFDILQGELEMDSEVLVNRSRKVLDAILQNYTAFAITTIDSFTHKIIKSFAYDLGLSQSFEVEMDAEELLKEAVDVLISKIGINKEVTQTLIAYAKDKSENDQSWDITRDLFEFSHMLLNEDDVRNLQKIKHKTLSDFQKLRQHLKSQNREIQEEFSAIGEKGLQRIQDLGLEPPNFSYKDLPNHFLKLVRYSSLKAGELKFEGRLSKTIEEKKDLFSKSTPEAAKTIIEQHQAEFAELYEQSKTLFEQKHSIYRLNSLLLKSSIPLATLSYIHQELSLIKEENNIQLNSEFNHLISKQIQDQPAPFIYERVGNKYRHYFIDEMQDTSQMQWENLIPLLHNTLSQGDSSLWLVGDGKQSIYRWRGGKPEQFINLGNEDTLTKPFSVPKRVEILKSNYRSYNEIVNFNNQFFEFASKYMSHTPYARLFQQGSQQKTMPTKNGGYVSLDFINQDQEEKNNDQRYAKQVLKIIKEVKENFNLREICILVRKRKQGVEIADYLIGHDIPIISSETLLLKNSSKVQFLLNLLRFSHEKTDDAKFELLNYLHSLLSIEIPKHDFLVASFLKDDIFEELSVDFDQDCFAELPLYEKIEYAINAFQLLHESDAYVQFFLDEILQWQQKEWGLLEVLEYWELKQDKLSIVSPETSDAVQIMTIHKSKGLEFPVVVYAGDVYVYEQIQPKVWLNNTLGEFDDFLVPFVKELSDLNEDTKSLYDKRKSELELDALNLLYVALTRAEEQLYVVTDNSKVKNKEASYFSQFFKQFLDHLGLFDNTVHHYEFGAKNRVSERESNMSTSHEYLNTHISVARKEHQIDFLANSSKLWGTNQAEAIRYGNLIHEILSRIVSVDDIDRVLSVEIQLGNISQTLSIQLREQLERIILHPLLTKYFKGGIKVFNERVLTDVDGQLLIPDRLIFLEDEIVIIDYKTGIKNDSHKQQLLKYERLVRAMGYKNIKKVLVYLSDEVLVEEF